MPLWSLVVVAALAAADPKPAPIKLAVPNLTALNLSDKEVAYFTDVLATRLSVEGLEVTTSAQIATLIGIERQKQLAGCSDDGCMAELADALGVDGVVTGSLGKFDGRYQLNVKAMRSNNAKPLAVFSGVANSEAALVERLGEGARHLAAGVSAAFGRTPLRAAAEPAPSLRRLTWIPATVGGAGAVAGSIFLVMAKGQYDQLRAADPTLVDEPAARRLRDAGNFNQIVGFGALALGAAAGATAVAFWMSPEAPSVAVLPARGGVQVQVAGGLPW